MDLGLGFDDSDFEIKQKITAGTKTSYNAKFCGPLWFEEEQTSELDPNTYIHQQKYSADYHFYKERYEIAAKKYKMLLERIPENNMPLRQDVQESLCRSYIHLGRHQESTDIAYRMVEMMRLEDEARQRQSLILLSEACREAHDWTGCVSALEEVLSGQSHFAHFWLDLGRAYQHRALQTGDAERRRTHQTGDAERSRTHQTGDAERSRTHQTGDAERSRTHQTGDAERRRTHQTGDAECSKRTAQVLTCFARARVLLESVQNNAVPASRERNEAIICQINEEIKDLGVAQELVDYAVEEMKMDLQYSSTAGDEDDQAIEATAAYTPETFRKRWFSWIDNHRDKI